VHDDLLADDRRRRVAVPGTRATLVRVLPGRGAGLAVVGGEEGILRTCRFRINSSPARTGDVPLPNATCATGSGTV
jgi:hypothetical protein